MAGYSGTPLPQKLGIKPGNRVAIVGAPDGFAIAPLPPDIALLPSLGRAESDVILLFVKDTAALGKRFDKAVEHLTQAGGLWIAWPKKSSGVKTDLTEDVVRDLALAAGLVDNKVCAIDETWSGLRIVRRVKDRKPS